MKSKRAAYLLWAGCFFGLFGLHRFYLGKIGTGIIWLLTGGLFLVGQIVDLFTLGGQVEDYNRDLLLSQYNPDEAAVRKTEVQVPSKEPEPHRPQKSAKEQEPQETQKK